jgi:iron complex outermembrane receptor protein
MKINAFVAGLFICAVLIFAIVAGPSFAEPSASLQSLSGTVLNEKQSPLANVNVTIPALKRGTTTDVAGKFTFDKLPAAIYVVAISQIGYRSETRTVNLTNGDATLTVTLHVSPLTMSTVTVTAKPQPTDVLTTPQAVAVLEGAQLNQLRGQTIIQSLEKSPGVSLYTTGAGIAKPVIRGLTSQRVLVVTDGVRQEGQQWGDEHGPEIDALDVDRIEVVRGPNSVLYGSDALGGVINIIKVEIPSASAGAPQLGGNFLLNGFSNNNQGAGALSLYGASGIWGYRANLSLRDGSDVRTPDGKLFNSGGNEHNGSGMLGLQGDWGSVSADYSRFNEKLQIHEDPAEDPEATPFQKIQHDKVHLHANLPFPALRLEVNGGWQQNHRREFEEIDATDPALNLILKTTSVEVKAHHQPLGSTFGTIGLSLLRQKNETLGEEKLIPAYTTTNVAGFIYEETHIQEMSFSAGLRYDTRNLEVTANEDLGVPAQTRDYHAVTGTVGAVWRAAEPLAFALNVGRGWRSPVAYELFVNGVHEGTVRFDIGDSTLQPETSLNFDLSARFATARVQGEITGFHNRINRFIFASPTGEIDPESGFDNYQLKQADATLVGAELSLQAQAANWLILEGGADFVRGANDQTDQPLPLMPANRIKLGARLTGTAWGKLANPYIAFNSKVMLAQNRIEAYETKTGGYTLFDLGAGVEIPAGAQKVSVDLAVENLFDKAYRDHLNRYKAYALNPGRNVTLKASVPFTVAR